MVPGETRQTGQDGGPCGLFSIKCYPHRRHPIFTRFSPAEQALTQSRLFDHTHTPTYEAQGRISPDLFTVAFCTVSTDRTGRIAHVGFESMEPLRTVVGGADGAPDRVVRRLSGIAAGFPLFDVLVGLCSFALRQPPVRIQVAGSPGVEFHRAPEQVTCRPAEDVTAYSITIGYPGAPDAPVRHERFSDQAPPLQAPQWPIFEDTYPGGRFHPPAAKPGCPVRLNEAWWTLAGAPHRSHLASACGCSLESHGE
jgi:hypothetical protein